MGVPEGAGSCMHYKYVKLTSSLTGPVSLVKHFNARPAVLTLDRVSKRVTKIKTPLKLNKYHSAQSFLHFEHKMASHVKERNIHLNLKTLFI